MLFAGSILIIIYILYSINQIRWVILEDCGFAINENVAYRHNVYICKHT